MAGIPIPTDSVRASLRRLLLYGHRSHHPLFWSASQYSYQTWTLQTVAATAQSTRLTMFVRGKAYWSGSAMQAVVDDMVLSGPPAPVANLSAISDEPSIGLTWSKSAGATSYVVKRAIQSGGPFAPIASGILTTNFVDMAVTNGFTYFYVVTAANSGGESTASANVSAMPYTVRVNLAREPETGHFRLVWNNRTHKAFQVLNRPELSSGEWTIGSEEISSPEDPVIWIDPNPPQAQQFYRIQVIR